MEETPQTSALVLGAISVDVSPSGERAPGGVVHYAGCALARLGARTRVLTRAAEDDARELLAPLRALGVEVRALPSRATTTYLNEYQGDVSRHELLETSDSIGPADLPPAWRRADLIQLGPLHRRDLLPTLAGALDGLVGLDVQGLLRERRMGTTRIAPHPALDEFLIGVDVVHASDEELDALLRGSSPADLLRSSGVSELLITRGSRGTRVVTRAGELDVPAVPARSRFPIGAGDVFLAGYLFARARGSPPARAAGVASRVSAAKIQRGELPENFPMADEEA